MISLSTAGSSPRPTILLSLRGITMRVKYKLESNVSLTKGNAYDVLSVEQGCYRIVDDTDDDYLYSPEDFEIIEK